MKLRRCLSLALAWVEVMPATATDAATMIEMNLRDMNVPFLSFANWRRAFPVAPWMSRTSGQGRETGNNRPLLSNIRGVRGGRLLNNDAYSRSVAT